MNYIPMVKRTVVEVAPEILRRYCGDYKVNENLNLTISLEKGQMFAQATGQQKVELFPESETEFFLKVANAQVTFELDEKGAVTGLILHQGGQDIRAERVP